VLGFALDPTVRSALVVLGLVGGLLALGVPRLGSNRTASHA